MKKILAALCTLTLLFGVFAMLPAAAEEPQTEPEEEVVVSEPYRITIPLIIPEEPNETAVLTATDGNGYTVSLDLAQSGLPSGHYDVELNWVKATEAQIQAIEAELSEELEDGIKKVAHLPRDIDIMLLNISIVNTESGEQVHPTGPVNVTIEKDGLSLPTVVQFKDNQEVEAIEPDPENSFDVTGL